MHWLHAIAVVLHSVYRSLLHLAMRQPLPLGIVGPLVVGLAIAVVGVGGGYVCPRVFGGFDDALALAGAVLDHQLFESHLLLVEGFVAVVGIGGSTDA